MSHAMTDGASRFRGELVTAAVVLVAVLLMPLFGLVGLALQVALVIAAPAIGVWIIARAIDVPTGR